MEQNMTLLCNLLLIESKSDLSMYPYDVIQELRKNITVGARDVQQRWSSALELVHKSFEVSGVQRPTPDLGSWSQYEELLVYAVQQLSKYRGMSDKAGWRMSSAVFHEALQKHIRFNVRLATPGASTSYNTEARSLTELIQYIKENDPGEYDIKTKIAPDGFTASLQFYRFGVKIKYRVDITQTGVVGVNV